MIVCTRQRGKRLSHLWGRQKGANLSGRDIIADISEYAFSSEYCRSVRTVGKAGTSKTDLCRGNTCSSDPFSVLCFFPSIEVVYIFSLCLACRLFSLYKGPVAEEGLIMWDAQFLLVQLPVVLREFCMGGCRCELKKMGRCWRNRRCCECEWKNWIVEHFLSWSKNKTLLIKVLLCKKSVLSFVHMRVSIWRADLNHVENAVSFRKCPLMIMALTWNLFLFPMNLAELAIKALSILCYSHNEEGWSFVLCFGFLQLCRIDYLLLFQEEVTIIVLIVFHLTLDWEE